ncbi:MAG: helix-turn-helix domain-containing protein [Cyclobacteriaceae bacterium]|nr:helix-turn-helix domain-containing protein [Cyclobacteriaceae bacterium]
MEDVIMLQHLEKLKSDLIAEMESKFGHHDLKQRWLRSHQLRKLLSISHGKLQQLRTSGVLPYSRIGSVILYDYKDIERFIRVHRKNKRR